MLSAMQVESTGDAPMPPHWLLGAVPVGQRHIPPCVRSTPAFRAAARRNKLRVGNFLTLFGSPRDLGAGLHQQRRCWRSRRSTSAAAFSDAKSSCRCTMPAARSRRWRSARRGHRVRRSRHHHGIAYQRRPRRAAQGHPRPHSLCLHAGL